VHSLKPVLVCSDFKGRVRWDNGSYTNANNKQDNTAIVANKTSYRPDDVGNSCAGSTLIQV
jgi:hypothetical protein